MDKEKLIRGIAEYKHEQEVIKRMLRRHKYLSSREFDRIFGDTRTVVDPKNGHAIMVKPRPKIRFMGAKGHTFLLGDVMDLGYWSAWLHLLQIMVALDVVEAGMGTGGGIIYKLKEGE